MNAVSPPLHPLSLNAAAVLTGRSVRTWQRRIEDGGVPRLGAANGRAMLPFAAVQPLLVLDLAEDEVQMLVRADQGDTQAQAEVGALFALAALRESRGAAATRRRSCAPAALHFLTQAAQQGEADAMHWLAILHAAGLGEPAEPGEGTGQAGSLMWMAKAAAHGHAIAQGQVAGLMADKLPKK
ncbi:MAG: hypothetical protein ACN6O3_15865 [Comamonas sp.]